MSSDAKDAKACYTKAGVKAAPIKHGIFDWCSPSPPQPTLTSTHNTKEPIRHFFRTGSSLYLHSTKYSLVTF